MPANTSSGETEYPSLTSPPALAELHLSPQPNAGAPEERASMKQKLLCLLVVFVSASTARAVPLAGVPEGYVVTPFGYYHSSCVQVLGKGDILKPDELVVQHKDGSLDSMRACAYAHYTSGRTPVEPNAKEPSIAHAWIEDVFAQTNTSYGGLITEWKVPPTPKSNDGQTLYFFPGMEDDKDVKTIIQPVLGWNSNYKDAWEIASWNCCTQGTVFESTPLLVQPGDTILGTMHDKCKAGTLECSSWDVITDDVTSHQQTELVNTSSFKQTFNWAFSNVLEVYNVVKCSDLPPNNALTVSDIALYTDGFVQIKNPAWFVSVANVTPKCDYGGFVTETKTTITY
jgi:hypothetical protein